MQSTVDGSSGSAAEDAPPERIAPGMTLGGRYLISALLGTNDVGWALAARDTRRISGGRSVVVHVLRPEHGAPGALVRNLEQRELAILERLLGEARDAAVVRPIEREVMEDDGVAFFVTELVDGPSLAQLLASQGPFLMREARALGAPIARTLAAIHACGLACGRLRPGDILLRKGVLPVIVDLGLAKGAANRRKDGSDGDLAPGEEPGKATTSGDVYRLGRLLRELFPLPPPRDADPYRTAEGSARLRAAAQRSSPEVDFEACVAACLAPIPSARPTALEVARALAPKGSGLSRRAVLGAAGAVVLAGAASAAFVLLEPGRSRFASPSPSRRRSSARDPDAPIEPQVIVPTDEDFGPVKILEGRAIAALGAHGSAVALDEGGQLSIWDAPATGQISSGRAPYSIASIPGARVVAVGAALVLVIDEEGQLWGWQHAQPRPARIADAPKMKAVATGYRGSLAVTDGGSVLAFTYWTHPASGNDGVGGFGENHAGYLAIEAAPVPTLDDIVAVAGMGEECLALRRNGTVAAWSPRVHELDSVVPYQIAGLTRIVAIAAGLLHHLALDEEGAVWAWGPCQYKACGRRSGDPQRVTRVLGLPPITAIDAAWYRSIALDDDGGVWEWGTRFRSQGVRSSVALRESYLPYRIEGLPPAKLVATAGVYSLAAASRNDEVWAWGRDENDDHWLPGGLDHAR